MEPIKEPTPLVLVASSPHMHCGLTIGKSMREVMLALVPAIIASVYYFRMSAAIVMVTCVVSAIVFETICNKVMHKPNTVQDGSAALTGLLLAMCLPASMPPLFAAMGSMFAIVVGKAVFGGLGCNIFNPAHIGRAILLASFPQQMTNWVLPATAAASDAVSTATPLAVMRATEKIWQAGGAASAAKLPDLMNLFWGNVGGSLGETCVPALVLGGLYLIYKKLIDWRIPVFYLVTVAILTGVYGAVMGYPSTFPLYHLFAGGLMIGAFFMATDWVTSPITKKGKIIYAIGLGVLTLLITCAASVALVAGAHEGTKEIIAKKHEADTKAAYKQVLPDLGDLQKEKAPGDLISDIQKSSKGGKANGYIYTVDPSGYGGKIKLMVGIDAEKGTITGIKVLSHSETPGLGARSTEPEWQAQFKGKSLKNDLVVTKQDPTKDNDIRAITAATITSRAVVTGVNAARDHYMKNFANGKG